MNELAHGFWEKAVEALKASRHDLPVSAEAAASRAYYAALYAVSALFIVRAVAQAHPDEFTGLEGKSPDAGCEQGNR